MDINLEERLGSSVGLYPAQRVGLFNELTKIAEGNNHPQSGLGKALKAMGVAAVGGAAGYGAVELMARKMKFFTQPNERRAVAARIILPILSGAALTLADRYRQKMNQQYSQVHGYKSEK